MDFELECVSPMGTRLAELADKHAAEFAVAAERSDRDNAFPFASWEQLRESGFLSATVPQELGGIGVASVLDLAIGISRLARGDGSTAIGAAMHCTAFWYFSRLVASVAGSAGDHALGTRIRVLLRACARGRVVACVALSERGTSLGRPRVTATLAGDRYLVSGQKSFCTNSPVGSLFLSTVRILAPGDPDRLGFAIIPRNTPGLHVLDNWDALGMRGSGSGEVRFTDCALPAQMIMPAGPIGVLPAEMFPLAMTGALVLAAAFLGIAEQAQELVTGAIARRMADRGMAGSAPGALTQATLAENEVDLALSRAMLSRTAQALDLGLDQVTQAGGRVEMHALMQQVQCANLAIKRAAIAIVDRCMTASGGSGYLTANPISRLYRDVRAGLFMQPFSALDAVEYIGQVKLGLDTQLD